MNFTLLSQLMKRTGNEQGNCHFKTIFGALPSENMFTKCKTYLLDLLQLLAVIALRFGDCQQAAIHACPFSPVGDGDNNTSPDSFRVIFLMANLIQRTRKHFNRICTNSQN